MGTVVAIGEWARVQGWGLVGVEIRGGEDAAAVQLSWDSLGDDVSVVILTPAAAEALDHRLDGSALPLVAVMPP
ncbi:hypothetical protein SAMN05216215_105035 [Saccharopolyspora shandongensis]|uniref:V/A-type H+-transporting ATPase subunit F n=2 Tax=Saccharopolyspora shandongensis TaxID=418495 RepID=A0A1H3QWP0_9PSEU|nr:hypothetical protein SAMN05216215_105035 [Saccharopolyspora shandongensis]